MVGYFKFSGENNLKKHDLTLRIEILLKKKGEEGIKEEKQLKKVNKQVINNEKKQQNLEQICC